MITDNEQLHEYIIDLLTKSPYMSAYSILIHLISYCDENNITIPNMYQPENSEVALQEILEVIKSINY